MREFRAGLESNTLLATHVGAEGLDFGDCATVVLLDPPTNVVQYVQVQGARGGRRVRAGGRE